MLPNGGAQAPACLNGPSANDVYFGDNNAPTAFHSKNGGMNWVQESVSPLQRIDGMASQGTDAWASGMSLVMNMGTGALMHSTGLNGNRVIVNDGTTKEFFGFALFNSQIFACGWLGLVMLSPDGCQTWRRSQSAGDIAFDRPWDDLALGARTRESKRDLEGSLGFGGERRVCRRLPGSHPAQAVMYRAGIAPESGPASA